jgi:hypothetical protein
MSLWPAGSLWGHPVLLTQSVSWTSQSPVSTADSLQFKVKFKAWLEEGQPHFCACLAQRWAGAESMCFCCSAHQLIPGRLQLALLEAAVSLLKQSWD